MAIHKIILSGFGGQGVMSMGMMLAYAGMLEGKEVTWLPSYGPEMRGGTANCNVIISDKPISSPIITKATSVVAMNLPSLTKFEDSLEENGTMFINKSLINSKPSRKDVVSYDIQVNDIATKLENEKVANMVMMGAIVKKTGVVKLETLNTVLKKLFTGRKEKLIPLNEKAIQEGAKSID